MRVLAIEPYYGGSHRAFIDGWIERSEHDWSLLTLPASKWKWRMRHGAMTFADEIEARSGESWDLLFCSDMLNLAELVGFQPQRLGHLPKVAYFHENQLTYPVQVEREWDLHFGLINLSTIRAADAVWFNSDFHRGELTQAIPNLLRRMPGRGTDLDAALAKRLRDRSAVHSPPFDLPETAHDDESRQGPLRIVWASRWEFDKNPELFFEALFELDRRGVDFRVSVLGESFLRQPPIFEEAKARLEARVEAWGFLPTREEYAAELARADLFVSTANHEFFGLSAVEAIAAGAFPLLPNRLAYPELLSQASAAERHLYDGSVGDLADRLEIASRALGERGSLVDEPLRELCESMGRYRWGAAAKGLDEALSLLGSESRRAPAV